MAPARILILRNPTAGRRRVGKVDAVAEALTGLGCRVERRDTTHAGHVREIAGLVSADDWDILAVAGGDGSISEAVAGLGDLRLPLAVIPTGTANVLAAELGLPDDPVALARLIARGATRDVRPGVANGRRFLLMAGIGLDARVVAGLSPALKRRLGKAAYVLETLRAWLRSPFPPFDLRLDGRPRRAASVIVAKARFYGGRFVAAPAARLDAPDFQVVLGRAPGRLAALRQALALLGGRLHRLPDVEVVATRDIVIDGPAGEPVQIDGDPLATLPLRITPAGAPIRLIVP